MLFLIFIYEYDNILFGGNYAESINRNETSI